MDIVSLKRQGYAPDAMLEAYPSLNLAQVYAALSYSYEHPEEVEVSFEEDRAWGAEHERAKAEHLSRKTTGSGGAIPAVQTSKSILRDIMKFVPHAKDDEQWVDGL